MAPLRYPIGIQTFSKIIEGGFAYVDKTGFIARLLEAGQFIFLSRPRRFGKSLLLSTLEAYFEGRRDLFRGLELDSLDVEWKTRPVVHIDFNAEDYTKEEGLSTILDSILRGYENKYGVMEKEVSFARRFTALLTAIYEKTGEKAVILVDEYDKPLLDTEGNPELFAQNQSTLKGFYGVLKSMDAYIGFAMLSGVGRFNKVSIFSDLNNLRDISLENDFADICGWTHDELLGNFQAGIERLGHDNEISYDEAIEKLRSYYDGYLFAPHGSRLYNPYSVLTALATRQIKSYWFQTGTPTFLAKRVRNARIPLQSFDGCRALESDLLAINLHDANPIPMLFQTGYLTIKRVQGDRYELEFPNREVEIGFAQNLVPLYLPQMADLNGPFSIWDFQDELSAGSPEKFMVRLQAMLKAIPYEKQDEQLYQNAVYLLFTLLGADARLEEHSYKGRTDLTVTTKDYIYIFEFKYNGSALAAINQIHSRDYAGRFATSPQKVILIGANFSKSAHGLEEGWIIECLN